MEQNRTIGNNLFVVPASKNTLIIKQILKKTSGWKHHEDAFEFIFNARFKTATSFTTTTSKGRCENLYLPLIWYWLLRYLLPFDTLQALELSGEGESTLGEASCCVPNHPWCDYSEGVASSRLEECDWNGRLKRFWCDKKKQLKLDVMNVGLKRIMDTMKQRKNKGMLEK